MAILHSDFIFVHSPKTAGLSITNALCDVAGVETLRGLHTQHLSVVNLLGMRKWKKKPFVFAFVRNPWDRAVSWYHFAKQKLIHRPVHADNPVIKAAIFLSFKDWLPKLIEEGDLNQLHYLCDNKGRLLTDYVGRFESLQKDFNYVQGIIKTNVQLSHRNKTDHEPFESYYDDYCVDLVANFYRADIEFFGYSRPNPPKQQPLFL